MVLLLRQAGHRDRPDWPDAAHDHRERAAVRRVLPLVEQEALGDRGVVEAQARADVERAVAKAESTRL